MTDQVKQGFTTLSAERRREIASRGGKACHAKGRAHVFTSEEARDAGRKGGIKVSQNRAHMALIGKKGGQAVSSDRAHMQMIGRKGGKALAAIPGYMQDIGRKGGQSVSSLPGHMAEIGLKGAKARNASLAV